ncbi:MAG: hypothetical protein MJZ81_01155 [Bacteroidales bacterium]|nr:hypothetical protein [Bacteroidales bacterium]
MDTYSEIAKALRKIMGRYGTSAQLFTGEVKSVEGGTCTVLVGKLEVPDVLLSPADDGKDGKLIITPKTGSMVTVADLSGGELRHLSVVQWGEVEKISLSSDRIELNGGKNGGLVNIQDLAEKLNKLEKDNNSLKQAFSSWVPVPQDGGSSLKAVVASWASQQLVQTRVSDLEDDKITH